MHDPRFVRGAFNAAAACATIEAARSTPIAPSRAMIADSGSPRTSSIAMCGSVVDDNPQMILASPKSTIQQFNNIVCHPYPEALTFLLAS
jgi:hypothetical protein